MGTHLKVLNESYPMNTNMTGSRCFSKFCVLVLWTKVASALVGLRFLSALRELGYWYYANKTNFQVHLLPYGLS